MAPMKHIFYNLNIHTKRQRIKFITFFTEQKKQVNFRRSLLTPPRPPKVTIPPIKVIQLCYKIKTLFHQKYITYNIFKSNINSFLFSRQEISIQLLKQPTDNPR